MRIGEDRSIFFGHIPSTKKTFGEGKKGGSKQVDRCSGYWCKGEVADPQQKIEAVVRDEETGLVACFEFEK